MRVRIAESGIFSKCESSPFSYETVLNCVIGTVSTYQRKLVWNSLQVISPPPTQVRLQHEQNGPSISVSCCAFARTSLDQVTLFWKSRAGWRTILTTAFTLTSNVDLGSYIEGYASFHLGNIGERNGSLGLILQLAGAYKQVRFTLGLFTGTDFLSIT